MAKLDQHDKRVLRSTVIAIIVTGFGAFIIGVITGYVVAKGI